MGDIIGLSTGFGEAIRSAEKIDKHFEDWIKMSQQITTNLRNAFSQQGGDLFGGSLSKAKEDIFNLENIKVANKNFTDVLETLMKITNYMSSSKSMSQELFDPTKIYASNESLTKLQEILNSTEGKINQVSEAFKKLYGVQESLNSATAEQDKKNARSSAISFLGEQGVTLAKNASNAVIQAKLKEVEEILKAEEKALIEEKRIAEETIKFNSSTAAEQIGLVRKTVDSILKEEERKRKEIQKNDESYAKHNEQMLQNELSTTSMSAKQKEKIRQQESKQRLADIQEAFKEEEKRISDTISRYKNLQSLLSFNLSAKRAFEKVGVSSLDANEKVEYQNVLDREKSIRAQIEQMEVKHQDILSDIKTRYADKDSKRVAGSAAERLKREEESWQNYLKSVAGATDLSDDAKSINEQKEAIKYLIIARDNLSSSTQNYDKIIKDLNNRIQKHRINIEQATKAEENENTILPKVANEYARILKEIDKLTEAKQKLESTGAYSRGDTQAVKDYKAIEARLQDLNARRQDIEESAQGQLDEIQRKHLAIRAQDNINSLAKQEEETRKKAEEFAKKYGEISRSDALSAIGQSYNTQNIAQAEKAIQDLKVVRDKLDKTDADYADTVAQLNEEIKRQEEYIKSVTKAEQYQKEQEDKANRTMSGAMSYSKKAKSIEELKRAMDYLQSAMNKEDISTKKGRENYKAMSTELERLKKMYTNVTGESMKFSNVVESLSGKLKTVFGVASIQRYVNEIIKVRKEFELQNRALQAILMDANKANAIWDKTVALAVQSPFTVKQLVTYTKQLAAYRIESDKLYDTTKMLADVSAGLGVGLDRLILAYGQVRAASFLRGTELRQFTEAGIPMLEELAKRFTELEGKTVSVGEVFSRISKRMVSFNDVAEVLKNLTQEGGTFYRMQEIQAETLYGQLSNLRDALDIMFNEIGKANDGVLKNTVSILRSIISNFREWAALLKIVGISIATVSLKNFIKGMSSVIKYGDATIKTMKGLSAAGGKTVIAFRSLAMAVAKHPFVAASAAIVALGVALFNHIKAVNETNKKYDELAVRQYSGINKFKELSKTIEENNAVIKKNSTATKDNTEAKKKLQEAQESNKKAVEELNKLYPESTKLIKTEKDGIVEYNKALENQIRLRALSAEIAKRGGAGFLYQDIEKNYNQASESLSKFSNQVESVKAKAIEASIAIEQQYRDGGITESDYNDIMSIIDRTMSGTKEDLLSIYKELVRIPNYWSKELRSLDSEYEKLISLNSKYGNSLKDFGDNIKRQAPEYKAAMASFNLDSEEGKREAAKWIDSQLDALGIVNEEILSWARKEIEKHINVQLIWDKQEASLELTSWRKAYMDLFGGDIFKYTFTDDIVEQDTVIDQLNSVYKDTKELVERMKKAAGDAYSDMDIETETKKMEQLAKQLAWFGVDPDATNAAKSQTDWIAKMISLVKDMNKSYEDLNKTFDKTSSKMNTMTSFEDAFKETFGKTGFKIEDLDFTSPEGVAAFLKKLLPYAKTLGPKFMQELQKAIAGYKVEIGVTTKQDADKEIIKETEALFDQYDLSVELKKLNIPKDLAKSLFNVDYLDLEGLKKAVQDQEAQFIGTDMEDEYKKFLEKIDDLEEKQQKESAKRFVEFLAKNLDQTKVVLEQKGIDISYAKSQFDAGAISAQSFAEVVREITKKANEDISKINFEKFKDSSLYVKAMGDLAAYSKKELDKMTEALSKVLAENAKNMSVEELEAYHKALEKIRKEQEKFDPFIRDNEIAKITELIKLEKELANEEKNRKELAGEKVYLEQRRTSLLRLLEEAQSKSNTGEAQSTQNLQNQLLKTEGQIQQVDSLLANSEMKISNISGQIGNITGGAMGAIAMIDMIVQAVNDTCNAAKKTFEDIMSMADSFGVETDKGSWREASMFFEGMSNFNAEVTEGWENLKSGNIMGTIANTIGSIVGFIRDVNKWKDSNLEEALQGHLEEVERLEKEYEKLEWVIDRAFSFDKYGKVAEQTKNLEQQIENLQSAIAAEEAKKDTDPEIIKEFQENIEEASRQIQELYDDLRADIVGTFEDLSTTLGDAMISALKQGEDAIATWGEEVDNIIQDIVGKLLVQKFLEPKIADLVDSYYAQIMPKSAIAEKKYQEYLDAMNAGDSKKADQLLKEYLKLNEQAINEVPKISEDATKQFQEGLNETGDWFLNVIPDWFKDMISSSQGSKLSGLEKGIQGMTEEQAEILASYWNSVRQYVANIDTKISTIIDKISLSYSENPTVEQLKIIAKQTTGIYDLLDRMTGNYPQGGIGLKVVMES